jgi:shikimate kinase
VSPIAVLVGPPAAGKSRLGRRVAARLGVEFVDTDKRVVAKHGPIPEIFASAGEEQFRVWEREAVVDALVSDGIVALGGGAVLNHDTQQDLEDLFVILVTATPEAIAPRLISGTRPLLAGGIDAWVALVAERQPVYDRLADFTVDTSRGTMDGIADSLVTRLEELR